MEISGQCSQLLCGWCISYLTEWKRTVACNMCFQWVSSQWEVHKGKYRVVFKDSSLSCLQGIGITANLVTMKHDFHALCQYVHSDKSIALEFAVLPWQLECMLPWACTDESRCHQWDKLMRRISKNLKNTEYCCKYFKISTTLQFKQILRNLLPIFSSLLLVFISQSE